MSSLWQISTSGCENKIKESKIISRLKVSRDNLCRSLLTKYLRFSHRTRLNITPDNKFHAQRCMNIPLIHKLPEISVFQLKFPKLITEKGHIVKSILFKNPMIDIIF